MSIKSKQVMIDQAHAVFGIAVRSGFLDHSLKLIKGGEQVLYWDDLTPIVEIRFTTSASKEGYALIGTRRNVPPVIEWATGDQLSLLLREAVKKKFGTKAAGGRIYVGGLSDAYVRFGRGRGMDSWVNIQTGEESGLSRGSAVVANQLKNPFVSYYWDLIDGEIEAEDKKVKILHHHKPCRYSQTRRSGRLAGCTPVAWAMYASALMGASDEQWNGKYWTSCSWNSAWGPVVRCVEDSIFEFHAFCATSASGSTPASKKHLGIEWFTKKGVRGWEYETWGVSNTDMVDIIVKDQRPALFGGQSKWKGKTGHSVVAYGIDYAKNWIGYSVRSLLICKGWGSSYADAWKSWGSIDDANYVYLAPSK